MTTSSILTLITSCLFWVFWFEWIISSPLKIRAIEMKHLDPSEIIAIPYELLPLSIYVGGGVVALFLCFVRENVVLVDFLRTSVVLLLVMFLCGGNIFKHMISSMLAAIHAATILFFWYYNTTSKQLSSNNSVLDLLLHEQVYCLRWEKDMSKLQHVLQTVVPFYIMLSTIMVYQILHILDWGIQMQRWPLPIVGGCTMGYCIATALRILVQVVLNYYCMGHRMNSLSRNE